MNINEELLAELSLLDSECFENLNRRALFPILTDAKKLDDVIGLCNSSFCGIFSDLLDTIFESWPDQSGEYCYPVIDRNSIYTAEEQYDLAQIACTMNVGNYGQKRLELYNYTAKVLNQLIDLAKENQK